MNDLIKRMRSLFVNAFFISVVINLMQLLTAFYYSNVYSRALNSRSTETLYGLTVIAVAVIVTIMVLEALRSRLLIIAGLIIDRELGERVVDALLRQSAGRPLVNQPVSIRDIHILRNFLAGYGMFGIFDAPWVVLYLVVIFIISSTIGWFALVGVLLTLVVGVCNDILTRRPMIAAQQYSAHSGRFLESSVRNAEVVQALGMHSAIGKRWAALNEPVLRLQVQSSKIAGATASVTRLLRQLVQIMMYCVGVYLILQDSTQSFGVMISATFIMRQALNPVEQVIATWGGLIEAIDSYTRVRNFLNADVQPIHDAVLPPVTGALQLQAVSLNVGAPPRLLLRNINLGIEAGVAVGIIGPSGSGKSTLARLIAGVYPPSSGAVRLDGAELQHWPPERLGRHVGYLPQDVELFDGSVAENIARMGDIDSDAVILAARLARIHDMVQQLPSGYETLIGAGGVQLSGGQRQRIGLARALYRLPRLVILDEPNASLDNAGEEALLAMIADLKAAKVTVVMIAHRPSLFRGFDRLLVLNDGAIMAYGPLEEVLRRFAPGVVT